MKLPYSEGSVFVLPLRSGGYARGVVARAKEGILFGYFFGPRLDSMEEANFDKLHPDKAILRLRFGDLGLIEGEWKVLGMVPGWDRSAWPIPLLVSRVPRELRKPFLIECADTDPNVETGQWTIEHDEHPDLPSAGLFGSGAVEIRLGKMLDGEQVSKS